MSAVAPLIACAGLVKSFGGPPGARPDRARAAAGRSPRAARPERRGQDDAALAARRVGRAERRAACSGPALREIGVVPQRPALYRRLSARENLELFARLARVPEPEAELADLAAAVALGDALDRPVERLSLGQAQRVNVAIGLLGRPRVVLLDEPTAALDPEHRLALWAMLERVSERGGAVAFATQNVEEARLAADRVLVLVDGRAAYAGLAGGVLERGRAPSTRPAGTSARSSRSSSACGAPREQIRAPAAQGPAAARALAAADRGARDLPARALAARRRGARRPGRAPARGVRERGLDPRRRARRRPLVRLRQHRARGRQARGARPHVARRVRRRALADGDVVAAIVVPRGFVVRPRRR